MSFQSTFPRGERPATSNILGVLMDISIHVPAWGTTQAEEDFNIQAAISIHVPAWGTTEALVKANCPYLFQSTFPRGERQICIFKYTN